MAAIGLARGLQIYQGHQKSPDFPAGFIACLCVWTCVSFSCMYVLYVSTCTRMMRICVQVPGIQHENMEICDVWNENH